MKKNKMYSYKRVGYCEDSLIRTYTPHKAIEVGDVIQHIQTGSKNKVIEIKNDFFILEDNGKISFHEFDCSWRFS